MHIRSIILSGILLISGPPTVADEVVFEDGPNQIVLETATRDYLIRYVGDDGTPKTIRWTPPTNIDVSVQSRIEQTKSGLTRYTFTIQNKKTSLQPIVSAKILVDEVARNNVTVPDSWELFVVRNRREGSTGHWIIWAQHHTGIPTGQSQAGYAVEKQDLPGVGQMWLSGGASMIAFSDEGPHGKLAEHLEGDFFFAHIDGTPRLATVPLIKVPDPFDAAAVLASIRKHLLEDMVPMKLVEPVFAGGVGRLLDTAIEAAKRDNVAGLRAHLKDLRQMLKGFGEPGEENHAANKNGGVPEDQVNTKLWPHPIAKLAARVLDFDLKYVQERIKG